MSKESRTIETEILQKARDFIVSLEKEEKDTAFAMVSLLQKQPYDAGVVKLVDKENRIYEVRGATKDFWIRLFWFYHKIPHDNKSIIVITNGYKKKQNKTDPNEIAIAKRIKKAYEVQKTDEYKKLNKRKK